MTSPFRLCHSVILLAMGIAVAACNSVLGIEEAQLDPNAGNASAGVGNAGAPSTTALPQTYLPVVGCDEPDSACTVCMDSCSAGALSSCLGDQNCRDALDRHRVCLGDDCAQSNTETWQGCAEEGDLSSELIGCAIGQCLGACTGKPLIDMCQLLCSCQQQNCASGYVPTCIEDCRALGATASELAYCRFKHCQVAPQNPQLHCPHAQGIGRCQAQAPAAAFRCDYLVHSGFPCLTDDECCSGACPSQVCN